MPVQHGLWKIADPPERLSGAQLESEKQLEEMIVAAPEILSSDWMLIGRQERTSYGKIVDLLAVAGCCAGWIARADRAQTRANALGSCRPSSRLRLTRYLSDRGVPINVLFFRVFNNGDGKLLSRVWLMDPDETPADTAGVGRGQDSQQAWNGEYYVSYDGPWEDAREYGFISGGGGHWYSKTLKHLSAGDRIWVNVPGKGYVGVGRVTEQRQRIAEFEVDSDEGRRPVLEVLSNAAQYKQYENDPDKVEYFVRVQWIDTKPAPQTVHEVGFFGNQNTVCRPRAPKWGYTVDRLKTYFPKWQSE